MLSRRDFLKRLIATAVVLSLDPYRGVEAEGDVYENSRLGLSLLRPKGWEFSSIADFAALRDRQVLNDVLIRESSSLRDPCNLPVFLFENSQYRKGYFAPAITLYDEVLNHPTPPDQVAAHSGMLARFKFSYSELEIYSAPEFLSISGATATRATWSYSHEIDDGSSCVLQVTSILIFRKNRVHTFYLVDRYPHPHTTSDVWARFINSISYQPQEIHDAV